MRVGNTNGNLDVFTDLVEMQARDLAVIDEDIENMPGRVAVAGIGSLVETKCGTGLD